MDLVKIDRQPEIETLTGQGRRWVWRLQGWMLPWKIDEDPNRTDLAIHAFCPEPCDVPGDAYRKHKARCPWRLAHTRGQWAWSRMSA